MGNTSLDPPPLEQRLGSEVDRIERRFRVLGSEVRLEIISEMYWSDRHRMTFSEIKDRISIDDHGNLAYHLDRLQPNFVTKADGGYELATPAYFVVMMLVQGALRPEPPTVAANTEQRCPLCESSLGIEYHEQFARLQCDACDRLFKSRVIPPTASADRSADELVWILDAFTKADIRHLSKRSCPYCHGSVASEAIPAEANRGRIRCYDRGPEDGVHVEFVCERCTALFVVPAAGFLYLVTDAKKFLDGLSSGMDSIPFWELYALNTTEQSELIDDSRYAVRITRKSESFRVIFEGRGDAVEVQHHRRATDH